MSDVICGCFYLVLSHKDRCKILSLSVTNWLITWWLKSETKTLNHFSGQFFWIWVRIMSQACVPTRQKMFRNAFFWNLRTFSMTYKLQLKWRLRNDECQNLVWHFDLTSFLSDFFNRFNFSSNYSFDFINFKNWTTSGNTGNV